MCNSSFLHRAPFRLFYGILGILIGLSVSYSFSRYFHNKVAAYLGLCSGFTAGLFFLSNYIMLVKFTNENGETDLNPKRFYFLTWLFGISSVSCCVFVAMFLGYLVLASYKQEALTGASMWMTVVWAFMSAKWAFGSAYMLHSSLCDYIKVR